MKRAFVLISILFLLLPSLFANNDLLWTWKSSEPVSFFRYRFLPSDDWTVVSSDITEIKTERIEKGKEYSIEVQSSLGGNVWSETGNASITIPHRDKHFLISLNYSPLSLGYYDFYNAHNIENARYLTKTKNGFFNIGLDFGYRVSNNFTLLLSYDYNRFERIDFVIPNTDIANHHTISAGVLYSFLHFGPFDTSLSLLGGVLLSESASKLSYAPVIESSIGLGYEIAESFKVSLSTGVKVSYQHNSEKLYKSMTYIFDALTLSMGVML